MKNIMTLTLSPKKPNRASDNEYTTGHEATIFQEEKTGTFGYRYHGVNHHGQYYQSQDVTGFKTKDAATKDALENYNIGTGC